MLIFELKPARGKWLVYSYFATPLPGDETLGFSKKILTEYSLS
jgi:hypothetical protein